MAEEVKTVNDSILVLAKRGLKNADLFNKS